MPIIKKITVTYQDGSEESFEGHGHISPPRSQSYHDPLGEYVLGVTAGISWTVTPNPTAPKKRGNTK